LHIFVSENFWIIGVFVFIVNVLLASDTKHRQFTTLKVIVVAYISTGKTVSNKYYNASKHQQRLFYFLSKNCLMESICHSNEKNLQ